MEVAKCYIFMERVNNKNEICVYLHPPLHISNLTLIITYMI